MIAERVFGLSLYLSSYPAHAGWTADGREVQIKLTGRKTVALREEPAFLLVMLIIGLTHAEVIYNGPGHQPWKATGKVQKNGQQPVLVSKPKKLNEVIQDDERIH